MTAAMLIGVVASDVPPAAADAPAHRLVGDGRWRGVMMPVDPAPVEDEAARMADWLMRQNRILCDYAGRVDVLPVKPGAVFSDDRVVVAHLRAREGEFGRLSDRIAGCVEYAVALDAVAEDARAEAPPAEAAGALYLARKKALRDGRRHRGARRRALVDRFDTDLAAAAAACRRLAAPGGGDRLARWAALLPRATAVQTLQTLSDRAVAAQEAGLALSAIGPYPPYSFLEADDHGHG